MKSSTVEELAASLHKPLADAEGLRRDSADGASETLRRTCAHLRNAGEERARLVRHSQPSPGPSMQAINYLKDELEETFDRVDKNGDRSIEIEEFATLMLEMDRYTSPTEMRACFDAIDSDHDGSVTFEEFRAWYRVER